MAERNLDRSLFWLLGVLLTSTAVNLLSDILTAAIVGAFFILILVAIGVLPGGFLRRETHGGMRIVRWTGALVMVTYPMGVYLYVLSTTTPLAEKLVVTLILTVAVTLVGWQTLTAKAGVLDIAMGAASLMGGTAVATIAGREFASCETLKGWALSLSAGAILLTAIGFFRGQFVRASKRHEGEILEGVALPLAGIAAVASDITTAQVAAILLGGAGILLSITRLTAFMVEIIAGGALAIGGVGLVVLGLATITAESFFVSVAPLLLGLVVFLTGIRNFAEKAGKSRRNTDVPVLPMH